MKCPAGPATLMFLLNSCKKSDAANQPVPTHAAPGEGWAKMRGWNIHASQKGFVRATYGMPPFLVHRLYDKEHYFLELFDR